MQQLVYFFWQMCLMRTGPDRAPTATLFVALIVTCYLAISTLSVFISQSSIGLVSALMIVITGLLVESSCVWVLLVFKNMSNRFRATLVALLGTSSILNILLVPFNMLALNTDNETVKVFATTTDLLVFGWWLVIAGFIYNRAMNVSIIQGSALALTIQLLCVVASSPLQPAG
jgi:hypothetical protein|tara:strand:- start:95 stop:613 length:519 start_codon:yes stop_codon:yes gene_type:complete